MNYSTKVLAVVYAIHDFQAENPDELSFSAGEAIDVTEKDDQYGDGWWQGRNTKGQYGLFPQAYTIPALKAKNSSTPIQSSSKPTPQLTMTETLSEVQHAIDQLHHPTSSSTSLPPSQNSSLPLDGPNDAIQTLDHSEDGDETTDRDLTSHLHTNPAMARALLAKKAQAESNHNRSMVMERLKSASNKLYSHNRTSVNSLISVPGIGEIELSEESGGEDDRDSDSSDQSNRQNQKDYTSPYRSRSSTVAGRDQRPSESSSHRPPTPTRASSPKPDPQDSPRQATFKAGPFSAAAMALGLTRSPKDRDSSKPSSSSFEKGHKAQLPSTSSLFSDIGLDLREHLNFTSAPVASTLRMSRQSSQFTNQSPTPNLPGVHSNSVLPSSQDPTSPQEFLSEAAVVVGPSPRSQTNLSAISSSYPRRASNCSVGSGVFLSQQLSHPPNPTQSTNQYSKTSVSTADSSSAKGSRSRSSSRVEQFVSIEDQASPATSTFPSSAGVRQGGGSLSSSHSKSYRTMGFGPLSSASPEQWSVGEVIEWAKRKGFDEFTISKFNEHEITGDVLIELDVNALKEIDLTAFGRRVRVMKAIDELKRHRNVQIPSGSISPHSDIINSIDSSLQQTNLSNPREELVRNHVSRPSFHSKQDFSNLAFRQTYQTSAELEDREEEEVVHHSARDSASRFSFLPNHSKRPSNASALSFHRLPQNDDDQSNREEIPISSTNPSSTLDRPSSATGRPRLATFSNADYNNQSNNLLARSRSPKGRSRSSSWTPATDSQETKQPSDIVKPVAELDKPIILKASDLDPNDKPKKVKKKKIPTTKAPGTAHSTKNKKTSFDSPEHIVTSPGSPQKSHESTNAKSRTSFLGNLRSVRKPPPRLNSHTANESSPSTNHMESNEPRPSSSAGFGSSLNGRHGRSLFNFGHEKVQGQTQHQIQHLKPLSESKNLISSPVLLEENESTTVDRDEDGLEIKKDGHNRIALDRIGAPDHVGWMRKKGEKYPTWKLRYFVLKGSNLYYLKSPNEIRIKGLIKLSGFKVVMDADVHPGRYGFRIIHDNGSTHLFSADDSKLLRDWMKAMMKATIDRDWIAPVISSCNIRTISIKEAQKMFPPPRPPSPQSRARLQKARLISNGDMLTDKDTAVLLGMQNLQSSPAQIFSSNLSVVGSFNGSDTSPPGNDDRRPRRSVHRPPAPATENSHYSREEFKLTEKDQEILSWIKEKIGNKQLVIEDYSNSMKNGMVLVRLIESLTRTSSGLSDNHFIQVNHLLDDNLKGHSIIQNDDDFDVYFTIFDYFNNQKIPLQGYSLNDLISGDPFKTRDFVLRIYNKFKN